MKLNDVNNFLIGFSLGGLVCVCILWIFDKDPQPQLPTDNELIEINDSTYYRINVRVDTTYFYDR